ncbi:hypothetical protein BH11PLA2_BH11PLA2_28010 [soil metagenome]
MRRSGIILGFTLGLIAVAGCHHDKYGLKTTRKEELVLPPDEGRFNNPPESEYKKPPAKKEFKPGPGGGGPGGGMGRGGMGGP